MEIRRKLAAAFLHSSAINFALAGLNLMTTVLLVRWFGAEVYTSYTVDLAILGVLLIILEIVPSNYSLFRVQDDPQWIRCIAAQIGVTVMIAAMVVFIIGAIVESAFRNFSNWMTLYAATLAMKRYLDIRLQSSGRLAQYMGIEFSTSAFRFLLLALGYFFDFESFAVVWGSIAIANFVAQIIWLARNRDELQYFANIRDTTTWLELRRNFKNYIPYYLGVALKRTKDNLTPILADFVFVSKDLLAIFFLAYRGINFMIGQVRIIEALLNHRDTLSSARGLSTKHRIFVAAFAQILSLIASAVLLLLSGVKVLPWQLTITLSFVIWPIVFISIERAKAYSSFQPNIVNVAIAVYLSVAILGSLGSKFIAQGSADCFAWVLVVAEISTFCTYIAMRKAGGHNLGIRTRV